MLSIIPLFSKLHDWKVNMEGDMIYTMVIILCSHLSYIYINSGRIYIKVEECFCHKEKVKNGLQIFSPQYNYTYEKETN